MRNHRGGGIAPGPVTPTNDKADGANVGQVGTEQSSESPNFRSTQHAGQALRVIDGESKAAQYLARLQAQQANPEELALIVSMLYGATLRGFCRVIVKALRVSHA
jgi:hypothetical protein